MFKYELFEKVKYIAYEGSSLTLLGLITYDTETDKI
jgi:hypothetical protein